MRGHRLWARHDKINTALLAMAESAGVAPDPSSSDILLGNLRRLHALRIMQENKEVQDQPVTSGVDQKPEVDMSTKLLSNAMDLLTINPENVSAVNSKPSLAKLNSTLSGIDRSTIENFVDPCLDSSVDSSVDHSFLSSARSSSSSVSESPPGDDWWRAWTFGTPAVSPDSEASLKQHPLLSPLIRNIDASEADNPVLQVAIGNPMEVSRNLQMPTISDLCYVK